MSHAHQVRPVKSFFKVVTTAEAREQLGRFPPVGTERVAVASAFHRVLAEDLTAPVDLPHFNRSNMDGYAVRAADTFGASEGLPAYLTLVGEIFMGTAPSVNVGPGQVARIATGGMIPEGADAVVMVELTQEVDGASIEVLKPVAPGENVLQVGEDIARGGEVLPRGHALRPQVIVGPSLDKRAPAAAVVAGGSQISKGPPGLWSEFSSQA